MDILFKIRFLPLLILLSFFLLPPISVSRPSPVNISAIRHRSGPNYTRVVVDLDRKAVYTWRLLGKDPSINKPRRLYIDIEGARLPQDLKRETPVNDGFLRTIRAAQYDSTTVRVVLDIETVGDYKVFPLSNPFRIVVDVKGEGFKSAKEGTATLEKKGAGEPLKSKGAAMTIVIDPGHGGKDPGAIGAAGLEEKDVTLKVAKLLKKRLEDELTSRIMLTRESDVYIALDERTAIANGKEADLFISVHANASPRRAASGVETYYLASTGDREAMRVAARENASTEKEMNDILRYILNDLQRSGNQQESIRLASAVEGELASTLDRKYGDVRSNGVKGALFYVLVNCNMPSILVEVSFISNPLEERRMRDEKYLAEISSGISGGILKYLKGEGAN